jgi:hypothetical protein
VLTNILSQKEEKAIAMIKIFSSIERHTNKYVCHLVWEEGLILLPLIKSLSGNIGLEVYRQSTDKVGPFARLFLPYNVYLE